MWHVSWVSLIFLREGYSLKKNLFFFLCCSEKITNFSTNIEGSQLGTTQKSGAETKTRDFIFNSFGLFILCQRHIRPLVLKATFSKLACDFCAAKNRTGSMQRLFLSFLDDTPHLCSYNYLPMQWRKIQLIIIGPLYGKNAIFHFQLGKSLKQGGQLLF